MLKPIERSHRIEVFPILNVKGKIQPYPLFEDRIVSAKKFNPILIECLNFLKKAWNWIKYHIFFFLFDETEDIKKKLIDQLVKYWDIFDIEASETTNEGKKRIRKFFNKLEPNLQKFLLEQLREIFKEASPRMTEKQLVDKLNQVKANPFFKVEDNSKPLHEQDTAAMGLAIAKAIQKLSDY